MLKQSQAFFKTHFSSRRESLYSTSGQLPIILKVSVYISIKNALSLGTLRKEKAKLSFFLTLDLILITSYIHTHAHMYHLRSSLTKESDFCSLYVSLHSTSTNSMYTVFPVFPVKWILHVAHSWWLFCLYYTPFFSSITHN